MKGFDNKSNRHEIEILSGNYRNFKRLLDEIYDPDKDDGLKTRAGETVIRHVDSAIKMLDEEDRFIIEKEVVEGKRGNWFLGYYSPASYYRHRNRAYSNFLRCL
jgi:hypothetical protein